MCVDLEVHFLLPISSAFSKLKFIGQIASALGTGCLVVLYDLYLGLQTTPTCLNCPRLNQQPLAGSSLCVDAMALRAELPARDLAGTRVRCTQLSRSTAAIYYYYTCTYTLYIG
jgi:hypothetical protein